MNTRVMFSSETDQWATPQEFFDLVNKEFHFEMDAAADAENAKCECYLDKQINALAVSWKKYAGNSWIWCNPPYGRDLKKWVSKAASERKVVMLIPARTDTKYFHEFIYKQKNVEIRFLKGRLKFGTAKNSAPFPSMLVIFK